MSPKMNQRNMECQNCRKTHPYIHKNPYTYVKSTTSSADSSIYFLCILKGIKHKIIPSPPLQFHSLKFQHFLQCFPSIVGLLSMTLHEPSSPIVQTRVVDLTPPTNSRTMKKTNQAQASGNLEKDPNNLVMQSLFEEPTTDTNC